MNVKFKVDELFSLNMILLFDFNWLCLTKRITLAARCNVWLRSRSLAGIAGSNPLGGMDVRLL
jgi:hypothetical protein